MASTGARSALNASMKGMKMIQARQPKNKKFIEPIKPSRWTIFRGDKVEVINGPEKGKQGTVLKILREQNRLVIEGVNVRRRTQKPSMTGGESGKIITYPAALYVSNVNLVCPDTNLPTKISRRFLEDGTKVRVSKRSGNIIPKPEYKRENPRRAANVIHEPEFQTEKPFRAAVGPKDTVPGDVYEVTYEGYVAPEQPRKKSSQQASS